MAAPARIANGDVPDADKLMLWLDFLAAGKGIKSDTYVNLCAIGGTDPFLAIATDIRSALLYVGDATAGDGHGFIVLGGY